jgi:hypothetical protein
VESLLDGDEILRGAGAIEGHFQDPDTIRHELGREVEQQLLRLDATEDRDQAMAPDALGNR